jgi:3-hydroxybutyryl-CoA dehydrogenase
VTVQRIGILGAGTMGSGIAQIATMGGYETLIHDPDPDVLDGGQMRLGENLSKGVERDRWSELEAEAALELLSAAREIEFLETCDLLIEAAPEDLQVKRDLFASLATICGPEAILATNTSSLSVTAIATDVPRPERVVGMHFFNPPPLMELVEIVAGERSSAHALEATTAVGVRMGRTPIRAKDTPGFIANRLARPYTLEALRMLGDGLAEPETIDRVCRIGGGFRMGPFELIDLIGVDVNLSVARSFYAQGGQPARWRPSPIQEEMVSAERLGRKIGRGFYEYGGHVIDEPDPDLGIAAPTLDPSDLAKIDPAAELILPRLIAQIANEAAFALEERIGAPADMNTAMRLGFNWPLGPLEFAELIGVGRAFTALEELRGQHGEAYTPAPLLRAAADGSTSLPEALT